MIELIDVIELAIPAGYFVLVLWAFYGRKSNVE